jgi:hypothetical protein
MRARAQPRQGTRMRIVGKILSTLGGQGPTLLVIALCAGLVIHPLAHFGYDLLPFSAFLLTLGSFLTAGLAPSEAKIRLPLMALVLAWVGLALPLAAAILLSFLPLDPSLRAGVLLSLLAPPVGSAAAIAGMLGLRTRLALRVHRTDPPHADFDSVLCHSARTWNCIRHGRAGYPTVQHHRRCRLGRVSSNTVPPKSDARSARSTRCRRGRRYRTHHRRTSDLTGNTDPLDQQPPTFR